MRNSCVRGKEPSWATLVPTLRFEDIIREAKASEASGVRWLNVGLHSTTGAIGTYVVLESGKEPNEEIPWAPTFSSDSDFDGPCAQLNIGLESGGVWYPGQVINYKCDGSGNDGYACKKLDKSTTEASTPQSTSATEDSQTPVVGAVFGSLVVLGVVVAGALYAVRRAKGKKSPADERATEKSFADQSRSEKSTSNASNSSSQSNTVRGPGSTVVTITSD